MTSLPLSIGVPGNRRGSEAEQQRTTGRLALDALASDRVAEERDVERNVDLGLARLPVEPAVEGEQLVEGRELDLGSGQDREIAQGRGAAGGDDGARRQVLVRWDPGPAVGAPEVDRVAFERDARKTLGVRLRGVLQVSH